MTVSPPADLTVGGEGGDVRSGDERDDGTEQQEAKRPADSDL